MHQRLLYKWAGAGIGALLALAACDVAGGKSDDAPTTATTRTTSETGAPQGTRPPWGSATRLPESGALAPGAYAITPPEGSVAGYRWFILTLPAGWATSDGLIHKRLGQPGEVTLSHWTVNRIYEDPCKWQGSRLSEVDLSNDRVHKDFHKVTTGSTVRTPLHGGLANQVRRNPSDLTSVELGGVSTLKIELSVPAQLDLATCDQGEFRSWTGWGATGETNAHHAPAQIDVVYMVDVDRAALVIDASHMPATSESDLAELEAILGSMIVDRGR